MPPDILMDIRNGMGAIVKGAPTKAVFERIKEKYKDRPELKEFIATMIDPLVK